MTNDELLHKWINGDLSAEEEKIFQQRPEYESLTEVYRLTEHLEVPDFEEEAMLANILKTKKEVPPTKDEKGAKVVAFSTYLKYGIAAAIVVATTWFFLLSPKDQPVQVIADKNKVEGTLPDQSTFVLNVGSQLSYHKNGWSEERSLNLTGEAFFKVEKGATFRVQTDNGSVQVLGTQFNVWSRDGVLEVYCKSGKVAVISTDEKVRKELHPTEVIRLNKDGNTEEWRTSATESQNWTEGISRFKNVPLARVLAELERQFDVQINSNNVDTSVLISCNFQHKNLNNALRTTLFPLDIPFKIEGRQVTLFQG